MPLSTFLERFCLFFILQTLLCCFIEWMKWNETATIIIIILRWLQNIWWYISHLKVYLKWVRMCVGFKWMSVRANRFLFLEHHTLKLLPGYFPHSHSPNERLSGFIDGEIQNKINLALHLHRTMCSLAHHYWTLEANISYRTHCWLFSCCFSVLLHLFFALFYFVSFDSFKCLRTWEFVFVLNCCNISVFECENEWVYYWFSFFFVSERERMKIPLKIHIYKIWLKIIVWFNRRLPNSR